MPNYDFKCKNCNNIFSISRSVNDNSEVSCPLCSSISSRYFCIDNSMLIKGNGFYQNSKLR